MSSKRFFRFAYPYNKKSLLHHQRDGESFIELMPLLLGRGYEYGGLLLNFAAEDAGKVVQSDISFLKKGDLIVMTTRPPLDDEPGHLEIQKVDTPLEKNIFNALRTYFSECSRIQVILQDSLVDKFESGYQDRSSIAFTGHGKKIMRYFNVARYYATVEKRKLKKWPQENGKTAAYFLYAGEVWKNGPDILVSFGMTGACNLVWAQLIRTKLPHLLDHYRIVATEMTIGDIPDLPADLSFIKDWDIKILLDHKL